MAFEDDLPVGYRFHPTEDELLCYYLRRKNHGLNERVCIIPEVDLCSWEPEELRGKFTESSFVQLKDPELWFFCEQKPGRTHRRSTKGGYWKKTGETRDVKSRHGTKQVIGSKKILTFFHGNSSSNTKTDWVMHEYHLPSNALDGLPHGNRKNYIVCMIRCNSDEIANSPPSYEFEQDEPITMDFADIFDQEADDGPIPEHLVQERMRLLEQDCWTPDDCGNLNFQPMSSQFLEHSNSSPESSRTQYSFGRDSIEMDSSFPDIGDIDIFNIFNQDIVYETPRPHQQNVVIMENKQTQKVESLPTYLPIHEKKGVSLRFQDYQEQPAPLPSTTPSARQSNAAEPEEEEEFALMWRHTPIEDAFAQGVRAIVAAEAKKAKPLPVHRAGQDWTDESDDESDCPTVIIVTSDDQMVLHNDSSDDSLEYPTISCPPHDDSLPELELSPQVEGEGTPETPETVEDNSAQPAASSLRMDTHRVRCKKESRKVVLQASSEAVAVKQAPLKIKEEMVSATSSSASIRKPRAPLTATPVERRPAAATTKKKEINPMAALSGHGKPARELKPITTTKEPISHSSTCTSRKRSCSNQSMVYFQNTLVGVILLIVIFCEIFNPTF